MLVKLGPRRQNNLDSRALSRKSIKVRVYSFCTLYFHASVLIFFLEKYHALIVFINMKFYSIMDQTTVKIALKSSDPTRNKNSNQKKGPNKSAMVATALPKNKQTVASSLCGNPMQESIHGRLPSDEYKPSTSDVTIKKSSRRRRSYTSILMEGSKVET